MKELRFEGRFARHRIKLRNPKTIKWYETLAKNIKTSTVPFKTKEV